MTHATPCFADIIEADTRIRPYALETPLLRADALDRLCGGTVLVKADCLQPRGAFKMRGAANAMLKIAAEDRPKGVVAFSSGNHAQGIAYMARHLGMAATIVVPADTPRGKLDAAEADGARIVTYDRNRESREEIGARIATDTGATLIPPFDHKDVIAGQGTCGLEIIRQAAAQGLALDHMVVCASGGGLAAGIALALEARSPSTAMILAEPEGHDDFGRSLRSGQPVTNPAGTRSIQDALLTQTPGALTLPILSRMGAVGVSVSDKEALMAMAFAVQHLRIVLEPGGAAALAAVLSGKVDAKGKVVGVTASGGNVDPAILAQALALA